MCRKILKIGNLKCLSNCYTTKSQLLTHVTYVTKVTM
jgi:hypothetical protein